MANRWLLAICNAPSYTRRLQMRQQAYSYWFTRRVTGLLR